MDIYSSIETRIETLRSLISSFDEHQAVFLSGVINDVYCRAEELKKGEFFKNVESKSLHTLYDDLSSPSSLSAPKSQYEKIEGLITSVAVIAELLDNRFKNYDEEEVNKLMLKAIVKFSDTDKVMAQYKFNVTTEKPCSYCMFLEQDNEFYNCGFSGHAVGDPQTSTCPAFCDASGELFQY